MAKKQEPTRDSAPPPRPTITLPPRPSADAFFYGGAGASPGPMTLVSSFFSDNSSGSPSFSQLLAGAMGSPMGTGMGMSFYGSDSTQHNSSSNDGGILNGLSEKNSSFKQNRPMGLTVPFSPLFTIPPGLSPSGLLNSPGFFSPRSPFGMSHQQALARVTAQAGLAQSQIHIQPEYQPSSLPPSPPLTESSAHHSSSLSLEEPSHQQNPMALSTSEPNTKIRPISHTCDKPTDDGYNWRKYGQKQVKGSEYPRSYYKCTHLNCPVKKKVEFSSNGQVTEIIYRGKHNHDLPQTNRRAKDSSEPYGHLTNSQPKMEVDSHSKHEINQECAQAGPVPVPESSDVDELGDVETTQDGDGHEPNAKRRILDAGTSIVGLSQKLITEPKIILQTRSEVDLLDDGYRWRKYGQKVVKGNPYPRSYYKCTTGGCNVRKHVERASTDPNAVITTYEGKHNHQVPAARNSSHNTAMAANAPQPLKPQPAAHQAAAQNMHPLLNELDFGNNNQRPGVLRLKDEQITV